MKNPRDTRHGCRVVPLQNSCAFLQSKNAVVSGTRMYRERTLLGIILEVGRRKTAEPFFFYWRR
ncbi:hypothetical protein HRI97_02455 [Treponema socranskii subsp. buccale]|uniref:hypothetical protein n=1 Tax=Treponema socranskii TaxID=53419 RepID=UPI0020A39C02|nr:hypothetical protein [Treponema socranskii]UTD02006.1 hypothetical protein HRI97_02455 [Treponema socranskii subsp. buccale]